ncbi:MAG: DUF4926 domain-containing protein [Chitinophagales bacterium]|nr:DUF4926 domain-containing protein [Chitinophagales bacterium]
METPFKLYTQIQLAKPLPEFRFEAGDVATIVEVMKDNRNSTGYMLEFFDQHGHTLKVVAVSEDYIALPPEHAIVNYRPYRAA